MNILDLDEAQGLTPELVRELLCEHGDRYRSVQELLREVNPRMRKGMPSDAAREASRHNGGMWIASRGELGKGGTIVFVCFESDSEDGLPLAIWDGEEWDHWEVAPVEIENEWFFWPCDEHGNKVRWPEKDGVML